MKEYKYSENTKLWVLNTTMTSDTGVDLGSAVYSFSSASMMLDCYKDRVAFQKECHERGAVRYYMNLVRVSVFGSDDYCNASQSDLNELTFYAEKENELIKLVRE